MHKERNKISHRLWRWLIGQNTITSSNIEFAANPCNIQGLLQLNQRQFEKSLKLLAHQRMTHQMPRLWKPICYQQKIKYKDSPVTRTWGTEGSPRITAHFSSYQYTPSHQSTLAVCQVSVKKKLFFRVEKPHLFLQCGRFKIMVQNCPFQSLWDWILNIKEIRIISSKKYLE